MIYLDNAATGGYKINAVISAVEKANRYLLANPGRSGHKLSRVGLELSYSTREIMSNCFGCPTEKVIFTKNCTEALNLAIFGANINGREVLTTVYEHNSVLRPLYHLKDLGKITLKILRPSKDEDILSLIKKEVTINTGMVVTTSISNVTGEVLPVSKIGEFLSQRNIFFVVDGAQGGGHIPLSLEKDHISALCLAGHKGLYGLMGTGALLLGESVDINPLLYGGTGDYTLLKTQPDAYPEKLEAGTLNLSGIASLKEGVAYAHKNLSNFSEFLRSITELTIEGLKKIDGVKCYSTPNPAGIVAFSVKDVSSSEIAETLDKEFNIAVRGGLHCAPLLHEHLKTLETGLVRASFSAHNKTFEAHALISAVKTISKRITD